MAKTSPDADHDCKRNSDYIRPKEGCLEECNHLSHIRRLDNDPVTKAKIDDLKIDDAKEDIFFTCIKGPDIRSRKDLVN